MPRVATGLEKVSFHSSPKERQCQRIFKLPYNCTHLTCEWASLVAQIVKSLPAMQETWVRSLGWEDSLGEGNGNPLQYPSLGNPTDRGAWWAIVHGVAKELDTI